MTRRAARSRKPTAARRGTGGLSVPSIARTLRPIAGGHSRHTDRTAKECRPFADGWTYQRRLVNCGRRGCRVCRGRKMAHGPYWYAERRDEKGRTRSRYIGLALVPVASKQRPRRNKPRS